MPNTPTKPWRPFTVAVLANSIHDTIDWLRHNHKEEIREINGAQRRITMKNGDVYIIVTLPEHANACEFNKYIIAPSYHTLEDVVRTRVK